MLIEFWDAGNSCKVSISSERIVAVRTVSSRQGCNITVEGLNMMVWVQESYDEVVKKLKGGLRNES